MTYLRNFTYYFLTLTILLSQSAFSLPHDLEDSVSCANRLLYTDYFMNIKYVAENTEHPAKIRFRKLNTWNSPLAIESAATVIWFSGEIFTDPNSIPNLITRASAVGVMSVGSLLGFISPMFKNKLEVFSDTGEKFNISEVGHRNIKILRAIVNNKPLYLKNGEQIHLKLSKIEKSSTYNSHMFFYKGISADTGLNYENLGVFDIYLSKKELTP